MKDMSMVSFGILTMSVGLALGTALGFHAATRMAMRALAQMIREGVLGYGPEYPRGNRLQAQANAATTRRRAQGNKSALVLP